MIANANMPSLARVPPHSRMFTRGSLGSDLDGRSREGRYLRRVESELAKHVGGAPNFPQKLLIRRAARAMLRLELMDLKMATGNWTEQDGRVFGGLNNAVRLCLRELGVQTLPVKQPSLADVLARHDRGASPP
jgi:hypothetical protein